jgi:hypothetical protein
LNNFNCFLILYILTFSVFLCEIRNPSSNQKIFLGLYNYSIAIISDTPEFFEQKDFKAFITFFHSGFIE